MTCLGRCPNFQKKLICQQINQNSIVLIQHPLRRQVMGQDRDQLACGNPPTRCPLTHICSSFCQRRNQLLPHLGEELALVGFRSQNQPRTCWMQLHHYFFQTNRLNWLELHSRVCSLKILRVYFRIESQLLFGYQPQSTFRHQKGPTRKSLISEGSPGPLQCSLSFLLQNQVRRDHHYPILLQFSRVKEETRYLILKCDAIFFRGSPCQYQAIISGCLPRAKRHHVIAQGRQNQIQI
ncbi:hypothetical protein FGO68_gene7610 [Halteria grandinella]|uniref:Uncharacterized protein n=1 Tax=Halteria grandinella TaxID=5974 RepID=A0A8J8SXL6_HALGN|nr:hypothetical protein FGO68_gene7610 [Halteria grandinella]